MVDDSLFMMTDFKICSIMQGDVFTDVNNEVNWYPGRLNLQSKSYSEVQLLQLAYCCNEISDQNRINYIWFFGMKILIPQLCWGEWNKQVREGYQ